MLHSGLFIGSVGTRADKVDESLAIIKAEVKRMAEVGPTADELAQIRALIQEHVDATQSPRGIKLLYSFETMSKHFVKVIPTEYERVLAIVAAAEAVGKTHEQAEAVRLSAESEAASRIAEAEEKAADIIAKAQEKARELIAKETAAANEAAAKDAGKAVREANKQEAKSEEEIAAAEAERVAAEEAAAEAAKAAEDARVAAGKEAEEKAQAEADKAAEKAKAAEIKATKAGQ